MKMPILLVVCALSLFQAAGAAETMRCSNKLIGEGDPKGKVAELCGKPSYSEQRTIYRTGVPRRNFNIDGTISRSVSDRELLIHDRSLVEVVVDVWLYNRGKTRLMREVVFHDNRVIEVNVLGRGY